MGHFMQRLLIDPQITPELTSALCQPSNPGHSNVVASRAPLSAFLSNWTYDNVRNGYLVVCGLQALMAF